MSNERDRSKQVAETADALEEKYGPFGDVYAEARSEAAQERGDAQDSQQWKQVADDIKDEDRE